MNNVWSPAPERVVVLGCGYAGMRVAELARTRGAEVAVTVRSEEREAALKRFDFRVVRRDVLSAADASALCTDRTHVVVAFPPDGRTDEEVAPALRGAAAITYLSTTGVYGARSGLVDDLTPPGDALSERAAMRLRAEALYRGVGATILRCPGIYGPDRGLHVRVLRGEHRIPGDGLGYISRIHADDLASLVLATYAFPDETFVVGDLEPAPQVEVADWVADTYGVERSPHVAPETVHETLRGDRFVDATRALRVLGVQLRYPSYRDGMSPSATTPLAPRS